MKTEDRVFSYSALLILVTALLLIPVHSSLGMVCVEGEQDGASTGSSYRICMPDEGDENYNGRFVIWAHGFQDVTDLAGIPEDQLCFDGICLSDFLTSSGFGFATNSYRKLGLAVREGKEDILNLVRNITRYSIDPDCEAEDCEPLVPSPPEVVYIIGASEGGLITTLLTEQYPDVFDAGYAVCGPIGEFSREIKYLGDARVTFEYFFPGQVPGYGIFNGIFYSDSAGNSVPPDWDSYFDGTILPILASQPWKARQWFKVAKLPYDQEDYLRTVVNSAKDVLRYSIINLLDARDVLGGEPFDNRWKWYTGSSNDFRLNLRVKRLSPDPEALAEMRLNYNTSGDLDIPLITAHTTRDQQVPYWHEILYTLKTIATGSYLTRHVNIPVDRYGHCNFTLDEALGGFALMLLYAGDWEMLSALEAAPMP